LLSSTSSLDLHAYCDADWNGDRNDKKSTTGWCIFLSDSLIVSFEMVEKLRRGVELTI